MKGCAAMLRFVSAIVGLTALACAFAVPAFAQGGDIQVTVQTDKTTYALGEPVNITVDVTNASSSSVTLNYRSGQEYDIIVNKDGQEVWKWSTGKFFTQELHSVTLAPGESRTFQDSWTQITNEGQPAMPGQYQVIGISTAEQNVESAPVTITTTSEQAGQTTGTATPAPTATATPNPTLPASGGAQFGGTLLLVVAGAIAALLGAGYLVRRKA
ncbi:MAG: BsuPI-related putative proteinase inhibitor [Chloroflexi bacterium]|nr:BsuPI-related putative proteinase inhibitor [Chloroflexota bacterium]